MKLPNAIPYAFQFRPESTVLLVIDMQRYFLQPRGLGSIQCGDDEVFNIVRNMVSVVERALESCRKLGLYIRYAPSKGALTGPARPIRVQAVETDKRSAGSPHIRYWRTRTHELTACQGKYDHNIIDQL